jgi:hypothetical protein
MLAKRLAAVTAVLGLGILSAGLNSGRSQDIRGGGQDPGNQAAFDQQGMEVQTRGPVHEAFAEPVNFKPEATRTVPKCPPDPIEEVPPDQKPAGENVQWIPGYWAWDDDRNDFIWISGIWRVPPPGRQWVPGTWTQVEDGGCRWTPGYWSITEQAEVQFLPPPPEPLDTQPSVPQPAADSVMIPGSWSWMGTRYAWRPSYWCDYRPGWVWVPAHYVWTPAGYIFVDGYWDLELVRRGLLFSPVYFNQPLWRQANWFYRPYYPIYDNFLMASLFIRPGSYQYYFGDFFDVRYRNLGFTPWFDYRFGRFGFDPLFSYYRWAHRDDRAWFNDLRFVYQGRYRGEIPRPPRNLIEQNRLIQNITVNNRTTINNINVTKYLTATAPLNRFESKQINLQAVPRAQIAEARKYAQDLRAVARERHQVQTNLLTNGAAPLSNRAAPQTVKLNLPKTAVAATGAAHMQPPPPPISPHTTTRQGGGISEGRPGGKAEYRKETMPDARYNRPGAGQGEAIPKTFPKNENPEIRRQEDMRRQENIPKTLPRTENPDMRRQEFTPKTPPKTENPEIRRQENIPKTAPKTENPEMRRRPEPPPPPRNRDNPPPPPQQKKPQPKEKEKDREK